MFASTALTKRLFSGIKTGFLTLAALSCFTTSASAGYVTTNETKMDTIFSQTAFGSKPIDIIFNPVKTIANAAWLTLDTATEFSAITSFNGGLTSKTINMFYIDSLKWCGGPVTGNVVGCGNVNGNGVILSSSWAANTTYGGNLEAHELSHNLGLSHLTGSGTNLMNPVISTKFTLTSTQVSTILSSRYVQTNAAGGKYISITPYAVVASLPASPVPEPSTWVMLGVGLMWVGTLARRQSRKDAA